MYILTRTTTFLQDALRDARLLIGRQVAAEANPNAPDGVYFDEVFFPFARLYAALRLSDTKTKLFFHKNKDLQVHSPGFYSRSDQVICVSRTQILNARLRL